MFYLVYRITNTLNGKTYVGAHRTKDKDDGYMGSGHALIRAIEKYGEDKFTKEILAECASAEEMFALERELIVVDKKTSYNMISGGSGGAEAGKMGGEATALKKRIDPEFAEWVKTRIREGQKKHIAEGRHKSFAGRKHTDETRKLIGEANAEHQKGSGNSQFGSMWIRNVETGESKKIGKTDTIPEGWVKGRKMRV